MERAMDARFWDELYRSRDQVFSGAPNAVLVSEITDLPAGHALDVGCGEGADALWLARHGWQVTAVDIAETALRRAAAETAGLADRVAWIHADLTTTPLPPGGFDLVSVQYFPLRRRPQQPVLRGLLDAVAPGGTFLFATHDPAALAPDPERGFDPGDYHQPDDVVALLDDDWTVVVNETRPRTGPAPAGTRHTRDTVLRARRGPR